MLRDGIKAPGILRVKAAMRLLSLALASVVWAAAAAPEYHARREALAAAHPQSVLVFFGGVQTKDDLTRFFQEPNFYYLTGWKQPGAMLLVDPTIRDALTVAPDVVYSPSR